MPPALSRDGQLMGGDGQNQRTEPASGLTSAQLEDAFSRAEDGIRTRDPHLGKVIEFVYGVLGCPLSWRPVYGPSTESTRTQPCCRAVYYGIRRRPQTAWFRPLGGRTGYEGTVAT